MEACFADPFFRMVVFALLGMIIGGVIGTIAALIFLRP